MEANVEGASDHRGNVEDRKSIALFPRSLHPTVCGDGSRIDVAEAKHALSWNVRFAPKGDIGREEKHLANVEGGTSGLAGLL